MASSVTHPSWRRVISSASAGLGLAVLVGVAASASGARLAPPGWGALVAVVVLTAVGELLVFRLLGGERRGGTTLSGAGLPVGVLLLPSAALAVVAAGAGWIVGSLVRRGRERGLRDPDGWGRVASDAGVHAVGFLVAAAVMGWSGARRPGLPMLVLVLVVSGGLLALHAVRFVAAVMFGPSVDGAAARPDLSNAIRLSSRVGVVQLAAALVVALPAVADPSTMLVTVPLALFTLVSAAGSNLRADRAERLGAVVSFTNQVQQATTLDEVRLLTRTTARRVLPDTAWLDVQIGGGPQDQRAHGHLAQAGSAPTVRLVARGADGSVPYGPSHQRMADVLVGSAAEAAARVTRAQLAARQGELADTILAAVSHDLRSPLATVICAADTLERHADALDAEHRSRLLASVRRSAVRVDRLVHDLLAMQQLELEGRDEGPRTANVARVVSELAEDLDLPWLADLVTEGPQDAAAEVDATVLARVLENLISNAAKQAPGSPVWVRWWREPPGTVAVAVEDAGGGVRTEDRARILSPFEQGGSDAQRAQGVGLGLHITRRFIELSGGQLSIEDARSGGASFQARFACAEVPASGVGVDDRVVELRPALDRPRAEVV